MAENIVRRARKDAQFQKLYHRRRRRRRGKMLQAMRKILSTLSILLKPHLHNCGARGM
jgi:hypothetical protein